MVLNSYNFGKFRVNANGKQVDIWLIYRCKKCKHSWNLTIYERRRPSKIDPDEYELFIENDEALALKYGNDMNFLRKTMLNLNERQSRIVDIRLCLVR